ncbi:MAG TPA: LON peptidase substrate-binding domain-containing protein [Caulobacterales bacterium]|nr:LON peptidase substrate-binding domain-containing protein [Caulobacterales bacterium]
MSAFGYRKPADLPRTIPLFPLAGALLFPRAALPLNIFEPRYLNMVDDALGGDRLIGMIQPMSGQQSGDGALAQVGCVGRITSFAETEDGRYLITLTGVCRFSIVREAPMARPYRQAEAAYEDFATDLKHEVEPIDRESLRRALQSYVNVHGFKADWSAVDDAPPEALVNAVAALCPFDAAAKQALLEALSLRERCATLIALLEWGADGEADRPLQ